MIYLIGGIARSGKSKLRKILLTKYNISGIGTDAIRYMLMKTNPTLGLNTQNTPDINGPIIWPYIDSLIEEYSINTIENYVIEGDVLLPEFLKMYIKNSKVKAYFIGFADTTYLQKAKDIVDNRDEDDWTADYDVENLAKWGIEQSIKYKAQCEMYGVKYYDTGRNFTKTLDEITLEIVK
jgi:2-phosphoglycerate kinase